MRFICMQNVMDGIFSFLHKFNFCYLLIFRVISSKHGTFLLSTICTQTLKLKNFFYREFCITYIVKMFRKCQYGTERKLIIKQTC